MLLGSPVMTAKRLMRVAQTRVPATVIVQTLDLHICVPATKDSLATIVKQRSIPVTQILARMEDRVTAMLTRVPTTTVNVVQATRG